MSTYYLLQGDNEIGKTSLVSRLQGGSGGAEGKTGPSGLEYMYINVKDDYRDGR